MICRLTDMEVANASLYDGGTAVYEAIMMALRITGRRRVIVDETLSPIYRKMVRSYTTNLGIELLETVSAEGLVDRAAAVGRTLSERLDRLLHFFHQSRERLTNIGIIIHYKYSAVGLHHIPLPRTSVG